MYRLMRYESRLNFGFVKPEKLDLAVPTEPQTIREILDNYPLSWVRASNANYFIPGYGYGLGAIVERGTAYKLEPNNWPCLVIRDGKAEIREDSKGVEGAFLAVGAGPILVRNGKVADIEAEIKRGGFTGVADGVRKPQVGVGLRPDGLVVHAVAVTMTLSQFASCFVELGCHTVLKLDSGGSATLYQKDIAGKTERLLGGDSRKFPCALVIRAEKPAPEDVKRLVDRQEPAPPPPPQKRRYAVIHHTAGPPTQTVDDIRRDHIQNRGWQDIGYNYLITIDGEVKIGRSLDIPGAHADGKAPGETQSLNYNGIGVACINNYEEVQPPDKQFAALIRFVKQLMKERNIPPFRVLLHREQIGGTATSCPGKLFMAETFRAAINN